MGFIEVSYTICVSAEIKTIEDELNIKWCNVADYYVKWNILHITMNDNTHLTYDLPFPDDYELKHPENVEIFDIDTDDNNSKD